MNNTISELRTDLQTSSRAIDQEGLCVVQGRLVWDVTVTLYLLNEDGNLTDSYFLSTILALMNTRIPEVKLGKDLIKVSKTKFKNLNVHHIPVCVSFYYLKNID